MEEQQLPQYEARQFDLADPPECDMIMKGGITSGIVYPYAVLEIATRYRLRSLGGTSAGAIAAGFAAAAEYARREGRPEGFVRLQHYCDQLPGILPTLFQPDSELEGAVDTARKAVAAGSPWAILRSLVLGGALLPTVLLAAAAAALGWLASHVASTAVLAGLLALVLGGILFTFLAARRTYARPLMAAWKELPLNGFGICSGLTQEGSDSPALTDWLHRAMQDIAFGDPDHPEPLTFGHLEKEVEGKPSIQLRVVTTNLSMRRPHTLPWLGDTAGFDPERWRDLFPKPVMDYLDATAEKWSLGNEHGKLRKFPYPEKLPVLVAVRMSLSFPLLFSSVEMVMEDRELKPMLTSLGGKYYRRFRKVHFSDGGLSSNFPVHLFDAPLPGRPTFAISLEELLWDPAEVKRRVMIPNDTTQGMGVRIKELRAAKDFGWQLIDSAKDWQDQLLSEITGQRERIARIYLTPEEGGLNLDMKPEVSRQLMAYGLEAGRLFCSEQFDFDEHRWRRLIVLYHHLETLLTRLDQTWGERGYREWYDGYRDKVKSYKAISKTDREKMLRTLDCLLDAYRTCSPDFSIPEDQREDKFPKKRGRMGIGPDF